MHYHSSLFFLLAAAVGSSTAQSTTVVSLYLKAENATTQPAYVGSVISAEPTATVYAVSCAPGGNSSLCDFPGTATVKEGPSTFEAHANGVVTTGTSPVLTVTEKIDVSCVLTPSPAVAVCTNQFSLVLVGGNITTTTTSSGVATSSNWSAGLAAVTITAGLDKLSASGGGGGAPPGSTTKPSAGGPRVTQQALLAGAAAVVGAAIML